LVLLTITKHITDKIMVHQRAVPFADPFQVIGIGPLFQALNQAIFYGIGMNVAAKMA
jgi:hypothetical protein